MRKTGIEKGGSAEVVVRAWCPLVARCRGGCSIPTGERRERSGGPGVLSKINERPHEQANEWGTALLTVSPVQLVAVLLHGSTEGLWLGLNVIEKQEEAQRLPPGGEKEAATWRCTRTMLRGEGGMQRSSRCVIWKRDTSPGQTVAKA